MVRDPSIVSPSLSGVFIGGGHNKHGTGSRCTLPKQCRPPSPRRRWRCVTDRATREACSAGSGVGRAVLTSSMGELQTSCQRHHASSPFTPRLVWIRGRAGCPGCGRLLQPPGMGTAPQNCPLSGIQHCQPASSSSSRAVLWPYCAASYWQPGGRAPRACLGARTARKVQRVLPRNKSRGLRASLSRADNESRRQTRPAHVPIHS